MYTKKPEWLRRRIQGSHVSSEVNHILEELSLNTVCKEANCPNKMECFNRSTATFMILGNVCTRNCTFCNVTKGEPQTVDKEEPRKVAMAVSKLKLKHAVITSVTRDDLQDGGAEHFAEVVREIQKLPQKVTVEVLIPDFNGDEAALDKVIAAKPDIINHNVETVPELYDRVRPMAIYERSLELLKNVKEKSSGILTKSGIMLGLGESEESVVKVMQELRAVGCDIITIGQYLAPSSKHHPVVEYVHPDIFEKYKEIGIALGFKNVVSAPLVRSSYHADEVLSGE
ncbi:MAG: Lipoyl synthase [Clostridia bacterium]|jgi:lipoic acid synthetase|nr:Lipoyl synthase [Clostridia bacterium]